MQKKYDIRKIILWCAVVLSVAGAALAGRLRSSANEIELIQGRFPEYKIEIIDVVNRVYEIQGKEDTLLLKTEEGLGYAGKMLVGVAISEDGLVHSIELLSNTETYSFIRKLERKHYFRQYKGKDISEPFIPGQDIDVVSGATLSGKGIANASRAGSHFISREYFDTVPEEVSARFSIKTYEWGIFGFFILSLLLTFIIRSKVVRILSYILSIIFLGFAWNVSFSISFFSRLFMGEIPPLSEGLMFWIFIVFIIGGILILRRNLYCYSICPFFAVQYFLTKFTALKWDIIPELKRYSRNIVGILLWLVLLIALLKGNSTSSSFEPFNMMFALQGNGAQWLIFPLIIVGTLFSSQFFCKYFCPVGAIAEYSLEARKGTILKPSESNIVVKGKADSEKMKIQSIVVSIIYLLSLISILYYLVAVVIA